MYPKNVEIFFKGEKSVDMKFNPEFVQSPEGGFLSGKLLIAMPHLEDPYFHESVIYVCGHDETGAMGIMINKPLHNVKFTDVLEQLGIDHPITTPDLPIYYGGPVEIGRGFVLHSTDFKSESSTIIDKNMALTATLDILKLISLDRGPQMAIMALGYVGWGALQLEYEIQNNGWIVIDSTKELVFNKDIDNIWHLAMASIGVNPDNLTIDFGHA